MSAWIISVVGVIMLGVLLEIVIPEGKTAKYVRGAFSLLVVFAIAAPLPSLLKKDPKVVLEAEAFEVDGVYVEETYDSYASRLANALEKYLADMDIQAVVSVGVEEGRISAVDVALLKGDGEAVKRAVSQRLAIAEDMIFVKEQEGICR